MMLTAKKDGNTDKNLINNLKYTTQETLNGLKINIKMKIRNKEYQFLGLQELEKLTFDYPNDAKLGEKIREIVHESRKTIPSKRQSVYLT
tara:strand:+ start:279 stop:548 length:270 start_codon:yes stop_codon:yes gene_type:complete